MTPISEEWISHHLPSICFRDGVSGRPAALKQGPDVWEIAMVARDYGFEPPDLRSAPWLESAPDNPEPGCYFYIPTDIADRLNEHFGGAITPEDMRQGLLYAALFPTIVREDIEANYRAARKIETALA